MKKLCIFNYPQYLAIISITVIVIMLIGFVIPNYISHYVFAVTKPVPAYEITTRNILDKAWESVNGSGYGNKYPLLDPKNLSKTCPEEVVIVVHGWSLNEDKAQERFDRVKLSLENNTYNNISLVGFSWASDSPWVAAKFVAKENGPKLADFISGLMNACKSQPNKEMDIHLIGHSLGARVILSALDSLDKNISWESNGFNLSSVHIMGAAVDDEEVSMNPQDIVSDQTNWGTAKADYGRAIEDNVDRFYNLFNAEDKVLAPNPANPFSPYQIYPSFEGDLALGQNGSQLFPPISLPSNYVDVNVTKEIPFNSNADGDQYCDDLRLLSLNPAVWSCAITKAGDSHYGYFGFRLNESEIIDDGVVNIIVNNWNSE
ncbi:DUF726 domain-containing protein [Candidatus Nitrosocosmicus hydrocola]|uniref:DUF726 domain-containing protein n=1 Tax=Candidatus Nitrosocosmicus hydrocola TaxID=1826872 RepID=UPI0011E5E603|nr:DUF726 domain-containing protein [Candidatus Nitrosocosmicus hydrocola]